MSHSRSVTAALALLAGLAGCGESGPPAHPVKGQVSFPDGDVRQLAGSTVEFQHAGDTTVRASGPIADDGTFTLGMYHNGRVLDGVTEGTYQARIILADEEGDDEAPRGRRLIHPRYLEFETSGLNFQVPTTGDIPITVSRR